MPTGLPLEVDDLLAPIAGDRPAGSSSTYLELRSQLDDLRREVNPDDFDKDDPARPDKPQYADWRKIEELTRKALAKDAKDLRLAGYLVEALVHQYQFAGLLDGLRLFRGMLEKCWDHCYPGIEDGDVEVRAGVFNSLDDLNTKGRTPFPNFLRMLPIIGGGGLKHSFQDWQKSQEKGGGELAESFAKALKAVKPAEGTKTIQTVEECQQELTLLLKAAESRFGAVGPAMSNFRRALEDCGRVARLMTAPSDGVSATHATDGQPGEAGTADGQSGRAAAGSRADAYRQLAAAAALLQRLEPHSPIPYLVQRAVELGALPFPLLMKALIRDANVLAELTREFGLTADAEVKKEP
jgi:type VI secretion system protein ImpA